MATQYRYFAYVGHTGFNRLHRALRLELSVYPFYSFRSTWSLYHRLTLI